MAGGLFDNKPFSVNLKCIVVSILIAYIYWYKIDYLKPIQWSCAFVVAAYLYNSSLLYSCKNSKKSLNVIVTAALLVYFVTRNLPRKNKFILAACLYLPYIMLAWWDYYLDCDTRMDPTIFPFGRYIYLPFKPPDYTQRWDVMSSSKKKTIARWDAWFFWLLFAIVTTYLVTVQKKKINH